MKIKTPLLKTPSGQKYLIPYVLVTSLFFLWGFAHGLLDVLNKHFQELLTISKAESGLVQSSGGNKFSTISWPYMGIAVVVLLVEIQFIRTPLPEIVENTEENQNH